MEAGVPCTTPLSASVLQRTGIRTAFAYLRIGTDPDDIRREDVFETIRRPSRGIAPNVVDMLTSRSTTSISDMRRLARRLSGRDVPKLEAYATDLETVAKACGRSPAAALKAIRVDIGLDETMDILDGSRKEADRSTHADDLTALESVAALHGHVATFETWLREVLSRTPLNGPLVLLSTVHRIKGREWGHVVIFDVSQGLFPHRLANDEEGERRVFHVALTRARSQVVVLADTEAPSMFLAELDGSRVRASSRRHADHDTERRHRPSDGADRGRRTPGPGGGRRNGRGKAGGREVRLPRVEATLGLAVEDRGNTGTIVEITAAAAVLSVGAVRIKVALGSDVRVNGKSVTLVGPAGGLEGGKAATTPVEEALRTWRWAMASKDAVPAYVILKDIELAAIAYRDPRTLAELADCRGIGQIRLERWGDEILAVLDAARSGC